MNAKRGAVADITREEEQVEHHLAELAKIEAQAAVLRRSASVARARMEELVHDFDRPAEGVSEEVRACRHEATECEAAADWLDKRAQAYAEKYLGAAPAEADPPVAIDQRTGQPHEPGTPAVVMQRYQQKLEADELEVDQLQAEAETTVAALPEITALDGSVDVLKLGRLMRAELDRIREADPDSHRRDVAGRVLIRLDAREHIERRRPGDR